MELTLKIASRAACGVWRGAERGVNVVQNDVEVAAPGVARRQELPRRTVADELADIGPGRGILNPNVGLGERVGRRVHG